MGFQTLFKFVKCWRAPDVVRETVPSSCIWTVCSDFYSVFCIYLCCFFIAALCALSK